MMASSRQGARYLTTVQCIFSYSFLDTAPVSIRHVQQPKSVSMSTKGSSHCMVFVIKTKNKCEIFIPIIFLKQDISKMQLAQAMYFYSLNLMMGYSFWLMKHLLQKVKEHKI